MKVNQFRKKPVVVDAVWFAHPDDASVIAEWCGGTNENSPEAIDIPTLEGTMRADVGDWVIRGVQGEFYPCKPDIFATTYERVAADDAGAIAEAVRKATENPGKAFEVDQ